MNRVFEFVRKERLYILLLVFVILMNALIFTAEGSKAKGKGKPEIAILGSPEEIFLKREEVEAALAKNRTLALLVSLTSLLIFAVLLLGILIDAILVSFRVGKGGLGIRTHELAPVKWNLLDILRVVVLFLFFGYMVVLIESFLAGVFPWLKNDNFRMMINSSALDTLAAVFIIYFTIRQYKEKLISLGLSVKNFFKNIFYGIVGYVAAVPALVASLVIIMIIVNITRYVPEKQPVVELFLKETDPAFLAYTSVFAAVVGPLFEELFFRGFMYSAVRKYIGVFWATLLTAAVFAALHTNVVGFLPIMVLGILLAYLYEKTGTLVSSITVHIMHNLSMVYFVFLLKQLRA